MTNVNDIFGGLNLKSEDLKGRDVPVTIAAATVREFDDSTKIELEFRGTDKRLICNKTNATTIAEQHGPDLELWPGKRIVLFPTQTDFGGKQVACIRVRVAAPAPAQQPPAVDVNATDENEIPF